MAVDEQPVAGRGIAPVRHHDVRPLRGLEELGLDADLGEQLGDVLRRLPLPGPESSP